MYVYPVCYIFSMCVSLSLSISDLPLHQEYLFNSRDGLQYNQTMNSGVLGAQVRVSPECPISTTQAQLWEFAWHDKNNFGISVSILSLLEYFLIRNYDFAYAPNGNINKWKLQARQTAEARCERNIVCHNEIDTWFNSGLTPTLKLDCTLSCQLPTNWVPSAYSFMARIRPLIL